VEGGFIQFDLGDVIRTRENQCDCATMTIRNTVFNPNVLIHYGNVKGVNTGTFYNQSNSIQEIRTLCSTDSTFIALFGTVPPRYISVDSSFRFDEETLHHTYVDTISISHF